MSVKALRLTLRSLTALMVIGAAAVLFWSVTIAEAEPASVPGVTGTAKRQPARIQEVVPLEDFEPFLEKRLRTRAPKAEPPPERRSVTATRAAQSLDIALLGTILEQGRSKAILVGPDGEIELKGVGDSLDITPAGVEVKEIQFASVTLLYRGQTVKLEVESEAPF